MKKNLKVFSAVAVIGVIVSAGAAALEAMRYVSLSNSMSTIQSSVSNEDIVSPKIEELMGQHRMTPMVLEELKSRHQHNISLLSVLLESMRDSKEHARNYLVLWLCIFGLFSIVLIRSEAARREVHKSNV